MENFQGGQTTVDPPHKPLQENHLRQTYTQTPEVTWKGIEIIEVMQLHGIGKV